MFIRTRLRAAAKTNGRARVDSANNSSDTSPAMASTPTRSDDNSAAKSVSTPSSSSFQDDEDLYKLETSIRGKPQQFAASSNNNSNTDDELQTLDADAALAADELPIQLLTSATSLDTDDLRRTQKRPQNPNTLYDILNDQQQQQQQHHEQQKSDKVMINVMRMINKQVVSDFQCYYHSGTNYRGDKSKSDDKRDCLNWSQIKHLLRVSNDSTPSQLFDWTLMESNTNHNYCRNPTRDTRGPWCYVVQVTHREQDVTGFGVSEQQQQQQQFDDKMVAPDIDIVSPSSTGTSVGVRFVARRCDVEDCAVKLWYYLALPIAITFLVWILIMWMLARYLRYLRRHKQQSRWAKSMKLAARSRRRALNRLIASSAARGRSFAPKRFAAAAVAGGCKVDAASACAADYSPDYDIFEVVDDFDWSTDATNTNTANNVTHSLTESLKLTPSLSITSSSSTTCTSSNDDAAASPQRSGGANARANQPTGPSWFAPDKPLVSARLCELITSRSNLAISSHLAQNAPANDVSAQHAKKPAVALGSSKSAHRLQQVEPFATLANCKRAPTQSSLATRAGPAAASSNGNLKQQTRQQLLQHHYANAAECAGKPAQTRAQRGDDQQQQQQPLVSSAQTNAQSRHKPQIVQPQMQRLQTASASQDRLAALGPSHALNLDGAAASLCAARDHQTTTAQPLNNAHNLQMFNRDNNQSRHEHQGSSSWIFNSSR